MGAKQLAMNCRARISEQQRRTESAGGASFGQLEPHLSYLLLHESPADLRIRQVEMRCIYHLMSLRRCRTTEWRPAQAKRTVSSPQAHLFLCTLVYRRDPSQQIFPQSLHLLTVSVARFGED